MVGLVGESLKDSTNASKLSLSMLPFDLLFGDGQDKILIMDLARPGRYQRPYS
jgi:hypothetical protein